MKDINDDKEVYFPQSPSGIGFAVYGLTLCTISQPDDEGGRVLTINKRDAVFVQIRETEDEIVFRIAPKKEGEQ